MRRICTKLQCPVSLNIMWNKIQVTFCLEKLKYTLYHLKLYVPNTHFDSFIMMQCKSINYKIEAVFPKTYYCSYYNKRCGKKFDKKLNFECNEFKVMRDAFKRANIAL